MVEKRRGDASEWTREGEQKGRENEMALSWRSGVCKTEMALR